MKKAIKTKILAMVGSLLASLGSLAISLISALLGIIVAFLPLIIVVVVVVTIISWFTVTTHTALVSGTASISNLVEVMPYYKDTYLELVNKYTTSKSNSLVKGYVTAQRTQMVYEMMMDTYYPAPLNKEENFIEAINFKTLKVTYYSLSNLGTCPDGNLCSNKQLSYAYAVSNGDATALSVYEEAYVMNIDDDGNMLGLADVCEKLGENGWYSSRYCSTEKIEELEQNGFDSSEKIKSFLTFPLDYDANWEVSSLFNIARKINGELNIHSGWDIPRDAGTTIYSSCSGTVLDVSYKYTTNVSGGDGNYIKVLCDETLQVGDDEMQVEVWYWHLYPETSPLVSKGDYVSQGQQIARVGTTGNSSGNHLHISLCNHEDPWNDKLDFFTYVNWGNYISNYTTKIDDSTEEKDTTTTDEEETDSEDESYNSSSSSTNESSYSGYQKLK